MPTVNKKVSRAYDVYIGRPGRWGNPFEVAVYGRGNTIELHRRWLWDEIRAGRVALEELAALDGKRLGCFCAPAACHGDTLLAAARWAAAQLDA